MYGTNLNAEPNFHLQAFNQYGIKYVTGPYTSYNMDVFRAFTATTDCVITATAVVGDSITNEIIYAGTTVYGLFISIVVTSGNAVLHLAEPSVISELVNSYYNTAGQYGYYSEAQKCTSERLNPYLAGGLYDKASWLLFPSQVEEDAVRAFKPADNSGSLSFTRVSDATRTNAAGEIERTPWNLLQSSEMLGAAVWTALDTTLTLNNVIAPNGTLTADTMTVTATTSSVRQTVSLNPGTYTASVYARVTSGNPTVRILLVIGGANTFQNFTITSEWQRYTFTVTAASTITNFQLRATSGTGEVAWWGAQLVEGTDAKPYFPTTDRLNVPRLDYRNADGTVNSCPRLLLEPQRTNSIRNSTMVGAVVGSPGTTPTNWDNASMAGLTRTVVGLGVESGLQYIDLRFAGTATSTTITLWFETLNQIAAVSGQTWTNSVYAKIISGSAVDYLLTSREYDAVGTTLRTGNTSIILTSTLKRFTYTRTNDGTGTAFVRSALWVTLTSGAAYDFTIRIAAPQMELGTYDTTFIPTTTAAVTRITETFSLSNVYTNNFVTNAGGTWFLDLNNTNEQIRAASTGITLSLSGNTYIEIRNTSTASVRPTIRFVVNSVSVGGYTLATDTSKIAITWNGTLGNIYVNGVKVITGAAFNVTGLDSLAGGGTANRFIFNQSALFPIPLTDGECITLTTL